MAELTEKHAREALAPWREDLAACAPGAYGAGMGDLSGRSFELNRQGNSAERSGGVTRFSCMPAVGGWLFSGYGRGRRLRVDRSERLLVELDHAGHLARVEGGPLAREATDLLEDNRLYRQTAAASQDRALAGLLDRLDRVLVEVAHEPSAVQGGDLARMREQMNLDGLLFELRVVRDSHNKNEKETRL